MCISTYPYILAEISGHYITEIYEQPFFSWAIPTQRVTSYTLIIIICNYITIINSKNNYILLKKTSFAILSLYYIIIHYKSLKIYNCNGYEN